MIVKVFVPSKVQSPSRSWKGNENAASPSALSENRQFQDPETGRLTDEQARIGHRVWRMVVL
jgi:hypothetical protein